MSKLRLCLRWAAAAAVVILLLLLAWQCADLYKTGMSADNRDANGVLLSPVYTRKMVAERLQAVAVPCMVCAAVIILAAAAHVGQPAPMEKGGKTHAGRMKQGLISSQKGGNAVSLIRAVLLAAALLFILLGVMNGGLYDVLVKAINICTECIGLG